MGVFPHSATLVATAPVSWYPDPDGMGLCSHGLWNGTRKENPTKIAVVAADLPHPEGSAVGRDLWAWCEGARALGHEVEAWVWQISPVSPTGPVPEWCHYEPFGPEVPMWREHLRAFFQPRRGVARARWQPPEGAIAVADQPISSAAVDGLPRAATIFHYSPLIDASAAHYVRPYVIQEARSNRMAARRVPLALAYSERVAQTLHRPVKVVPAAYPVPPEALAPVGEPVAVLMANWGWAPNRVALKTLLSLWPAVREKVPGARLLLAGRMMDRGAAGRAPGVEFLGKVGSAADVLSQAALVAFPCPASTGPKVKVIEALAYGLPVVTTPAGVEGLVLGPGEGAAVTDLDGFAKTLAELLLSPERRVALGQSGRVAVQAHHSPVASARARLNALTDAFETASAVAARPVRS